MISTRYDINFLEIHLKNIITILQNVVSLERNEFMDLPIVNDTFIVFPYKMLNHFLMVVEMETNPPME